MLLMLILGKLPAKALLKLPATRSMRKGLQKKKKWLGGKSDINFKTDKTRGNRGKSSFFRLFYISAGSYPQTFQCILIQTRKIYHRWKLDNRFWIGIWYTKLQCKTWIGIKASEKWIFFRLYFYKIIFNPKSNSYQNFIGQSMILFLKNEYSPPNY